ncbi:formin [Trypanosoma grayi]|uniref:formin n=1 Tax=Trypanosoma grayi TaxID=71804 RepID=UPI0004F4298D|nr:formin [Trypanosoma grayi]KEG08025.1 formin [Trypanosoma grayi]
MKPLFVGPKLKTFFWKKLQRPVGVWSHRNSSAVEDVVDEPFLLAMFEVRKKSTSLVLSNKGPNDPKTEGLRKSSALGVQRKQNIAICLKKLKIPVDEMCRGLIECDDVMLPSEKLEALLSALPTPEEIAALTAERAAGNVAWTDVEEYIHKLCTTVTDVRERILLWLASGETAELVSFTEERLDVIEKAVSVATKKTSKLSQVFHTVLEFGNFMNRGSAYADAVGFRLESLNQMNFVKAVDGKTTMLEVFVVSLQDRRPDLLRFVEEVECLDNLAGTTVQEVGQSVAQLNFTLQKMRRTVEESRRPGVQEKRAAMYPPGVVDAFPDLMAAHVAEYLSIVSQLALRHQRLKDDVSAMLESYGEDPTLGETVLWNHIMHFRTDVENSMKRAEVEALDKRALLKAVGVDLDASASLRSFAEEKVEEENKKDEEEEDDGAAKGSNGHTRSDSPK